MVYNNNILVIQKMKKSKMKRKKVYNVSKILKMTKIH